MARMEDWQVEAQASLRMENWSLSGMNRIVKVVRRDRPESKTLGGYITLAKFLINKTPSQIERDLGLPRRYLAEGAKIYRFTRLPQSSEYEYDLTANFPGGLVYSSLSNPLYPPGSQKIHQWKLRANIPIDSLNFLDLKPNDRFPVAWLSK